ncbi:MAG: RidA family protein [Treponema sp.]|jgi:2-iminobutanoate/2-iminopropanoate deaminase|nr:RidA family protein [Treponema sp.]
MKKTVSTPKAPKAIGPYSQAIEAAGFVYISGQLPVDPETAEISGDAPAQAQRSLKNIDAILREAGCGRGDVIKTTIFLKNMGDFEGVNRVYAEFFEGFPFPARSTVEVRRLPRDALVEIEAVAVRTEAG